MAELAGHGSGSAVYLVHQKRATHRRKGRTKEERFRRAFFTKERMLSQAECERPVTWRTQKAGKPIAARDATNLKQVCGGFLFM